MTPRADNRITGAGAMSSQEAMSKTRAHFEAQGLNIALLSDENDYRFWLMYDRLRWGDPGTADGDAPRTDEPGTQARPGRSTS